MRTVDVPEQRPNYSLAGRKQKRSTGFGHPIMFGFKETEHYARFPEGGGYPIGFLKRAFVEMGVRNPAHVLHVCSGSVRSGIRIDRRISLSPSIVADALRLPFADHTFKFALADPPYAESYAETLYGLGKEYPRPGTLLRELARVVRPGGKIGFMHHVVPKWQGCALKLIRVYGITQGPGYAIRAWSLFERLEDK